MRTAGGRAFLGGEELLLMPTEDKARRRDAEKVARKHQKKGLRQKNPLPLENGALFEVVRASEKKRNETLARTPKRLLRGWTSNSVPRRNRKHWG